MCDNWDPIKIPVTSHTKETTVVRQGDSEMDKKLPLPDHVNYTKSRFIAWSEPMSQKQRTQPAAALSKKKVVNAVYVPATRDLPCTRPTLSITSVSKC